MKKQTFCSLIILCCFSSAMFAQLTGIKNIPGDYATITAAVTALNTAGVGSGGVTFNVAANYTETISTTISLIATGTALNPVIFRKDPATSGNNPVITSYTNGTGTPGTATQDGIWRLVGSDYITIDGIDVSDNPANTSNPSTMEYGYALYKASTANGCQFVTIQNCVITLNNINNATGSAPMVDGSTGIIVMNALPTAAITALIPVAGGVHSNNKFYSNIIRNCNTGIALIGYASASPFTLSDTNNDVGGTNASKGNTIVNYGGAAGASNAAAAIRTLAQYALNVSYNTINNNNGSGTNHPNTLRGIYNNIATSASSTITFNTITLNGGGTTQTVTGIENTAGSTAAANTINISNNTITNSTYATATTGGFMGIYNSASPTTLLINNNTVSNNSSAAITTGYLYAIYNTGIASAVSINSNFITGNSTAALTTGLHTGIYNAASVPALNINNNTIAGQTTSSVSGLYYAIYNSGTVTGTININSNNIGTSVLPVINFTAANTGLQLLINNTKGGASAALSISNNNFYTILYSATGTGTNTYISNGAATLSQAINDNTFNSLNINTSGNVTFIYNNVALSAAGVQNVNNNAIVGGFTKAGGGTVTLFTSSATSLANSITNNNNNNFSGITLSGSTIMAGWVNTDAGAGIKTIQNNTFTNWVAGTGYVNGMNVNLKGTNNAITGNIINNISGGGAVTGIVTAAGNDNIFLNVINTLSTTGAAAVSGISVTSGTTKNIYRNKIYDLQANNTLTGAVVNGIVVSGSSIVSANIFNNLIGDLRTPSSSATDPIRGISIISSTLNSTINLYYNTIYLNASSTGATFGTTGIYHTASATATTATLNLRNNIVNNISAPNGTGLTVAYRRSATTLANYAATSNNNLFYGGPAGTNRLIFFDGTNADQRLASYKTRVSTIDALSVTEDVSSKFLSVSGSAATFLHLDPSKPSQVESGAANISGYTNDWDAETRQGNNGYSGTGTAPDIGADEYVGIKSSVISGTYNVGVGQTFTSLTNAGGLFAAINSLGLAGNVIVNITSDLTEDGSNGLSLWGEQGTGNYTLTIQPDGSTVRTISGNVVAGLIRLNGANRVLINGSNGTTSNFLTFRNTNTAVTTGTALTFINGASNNTISYCNIEAAANALNGVILFSTSSVAGGNTNNVINNCNINATVNGNTANVGIYSAGTATAGYANSANTFANNNIFNFRDRGLDITATGSTAWIISGNSFYNGDISGSISYAAATTLHIIRILGGAGYSILKNYIGGNAALATGASAVYASTSGLLTYYGIVLTTSGATPASTIKGNTLGLITVNSAPTNTVSITNVFIGIETNGSGISIGGSGAGDGNTIGSNTTNGSILITTTTSVITQRSYIRGISCNSTGGLIIGNQVGSIDIKNIGAAPAPSTIYCIYTNNAVPTSQVNNNIIGSTGAGAAANSIRVLSTSTALGTSLTGIQIGTSVTSTILVSGNIIQNINHQTSVSSGVLYAISTSAVTPSVVTITNNTINVNTVNGTSCSFYGINNSNSNPATLTINNNTISGNINNTTTGNLYGIYTVSTPSPGTINITNNTFSANANNTSTGVLDGIYNSTAATTLSITGNIFTGNTIASVGGLFYAVFNAGAITTTININSNSIGTAALKAITYTAANTGAQVFITNTAGSATSALSISNNDFQGITYTPGGTGANTYISNSAATLSQAINGNTFTNLNVNTTGGITFISDNVIVSGTGTQNVNNNSIVGGFTRKAGGNLTLFNSIVASVNGSIINNNSNNFSNITVTGAVTILGWVNTDAGNSTKTLQNNTFSNWSAGTGAVTVMSVNLTGAGNATTGNVINNISGSASITGISTGTGNDNIYGNTINTISSTGTSAIVTGIAIIGGTTKNIYKNKIYDLSASLFTGSVNGILVTAGTTVNIYNNLIGDLRTPAGSVSTGADAIRGISVFSNTPGSTINVYYNTIYLNASSTGTTFSTSGVYHAVNATATTAALNLRNNSITNVSAAKGVGVTVAYRITGTTLNNYATTSNNNLFYAGTPGASKLIFYDSTNADQTIAAFKTRMSSRDAQSVTENLITKFLSVTGSSSLFLHMDAAQPTSIESGAVNISGFTDDFDGQIRAGNTGYTGSGTSPDIGADEVFGIEVVPPTISYTVLSNVTSTTNRNVAGITITDASGINNNAGNKPRIYFKRFSDANTWLDNTSATNGWKFTEATNAVSPYTFTINYSLLYGGSAVTAGLIQYFVIAQDLSTIANIAINSGTPNTAPTSVALTAAAFPITGAINNYTIPFSGTYNVGIGEVFTSLTKADGLFASINNVGLMGNTIFNITSDLTEDGSNALNQWTESGTGSYTFKIQPDAATLRTISGNVLAGLIRLNGADRVTIDGSLGGNGIYLSFRNTNTAGTTGTAFTFINGASNNKIRYCDAQAYANATNGVMLFSTSSIAGGNSNNQVDNCTLNATVVSNTGNVAIYSAGTTSNENASDTLSNNTIYGYRDRGMDITATGSNAWVISGNNFYNGDISAAINYAASSTLHGIRVLGGSGYSIINNFIGGNDIQASGANAIYSSTSGNLSYQGILLTTTSATPASSIKGNTVASITISSLPAAANADAFSGITTSGLGINIGGNTAAEGNTIGSGLINGSISITTSTTSTLNTSIITGINCTSSGGIINYNQVSGIDIKNIGSSPAASLFQGIYINQAAPPTQVNNNLVGSATTTNSIRVVSASTATTTTLTGIGIGTAVNAAMDISANAVENIGNLSATSSGSFTGINNTATLSSANITISYDTIQFINSAANASSGSALYAGIISGSACTISNNLINKLTLSSSGTNAQIEGIYISGAYASTISGNIISNLSTASSKTTANVETGTPAGSAIIGILNATSVAGQIINNNRFSGFSATSNAAINIVITGIGITSSGSGNIFNNRFGTFTNLATGAAPAICHIMATAGSFNVYNNTLRISNLTNTNSMKVYGIVHAAATSWNYFHNTVRVGGSTSGAALRSAAFLLSGNSSPVLKNNIFFNIRTGTGNNYSVSNLASTAAVWSATTSDYNDLYSIDLNTVGEWGNATSKTFAQWQAISGGDAHSISNAIIFVTSTYDLEPDSITNCNFNNAGIPITTPVIINTDINNKPRSAINPDLGSYEFNYVGFSIIAGSNSPVCAGDSLSLSVNPGEALNPSYSWRNPANAVISTKQNPTVILSAGQYKITITDSTGCFVTDSTLVSVNQRPTATLTSATSICDSGIVNLIITVTGTGLITGSLSSGDDFSGTAPVITLPFSINSSASYSITNLSDANCTSIPSDIRDTVVIIVTHKGDWLGITSNWNDPVNWCAGIIPTSTSDVNIPAGISIMPVIKDSAFCRNLTINAGDTLSITATGILKIAGTLTNSGIYNDLGITHFNGSSGQQTFSGVATFNSIVLNNSSGLLLPAAITINKNLTISAGTLNANNFGITIRGNWYNNVSAAAFTAGTGIVTFTSTVNQFIGGTFATGFNNLTIAGTAATVTLQANTSISGNLIVSTGTFDLGAFNANGSAGSTLTVSNNATLKVGGTNTFPTGYSSYTFVVASTVEYSGTNQTIANLTYGNLTVSSASGAAVKTFPGTALTVVGNLSSILGLGTSVSFTAGSDIAVSRNVSIGTGTIFNGSSYALSVGGNWINNGIFNGGTSTVTFIGPGSVVGGSGVQNFNTLSIGASLITFSAVSISVSGNLTTVSSGSFSQATGGILIMTGTGTAIGGSGIVLDNLTVSGSVNTSTSFTVKGNLSVSGSGSLTASAGVITMTGDLKTITGTGALVLYRLNISGTISTNINFSVSSALSVNSSGSFTATAGTATFTGSSSLSGIANLYNTNLNGSSLQLSANSVLGIANIFTIISGTLDVTSSAPNTVNFNGTGAQNINAITYSHLFLSNGNTKTSLGSIITKFDINIGTGTTFNPSSFTYSVYGNWVNYGTFIPGASTVEFLGPATAYITGVTTFNILTSNTSSVTTVLILQNNISAAIVNMTAGIIETGSNTLTITNTRTGNGFIQGNIQRTHAFTTGVAYAFEGPDNTITFSAVSSVSSITVSVAEGVISDFPFGSSISRLYTVAVPSGTYTATLRLHYEDDELNGNNESTMGLWNFNGSLWSSTGKSGNSTTTNYVEQTGLTNITNRWTASASSNLVRWNGSVNTDWNTAANWSVIQGSGSQPPSVSDIVDLGGATFTNQPTITGIVSVKNIIFGSAQAVTLTLGNGGALTTLGNINGNWASNVTHTINVNNQSVTVNGNIELSDGTDGHAINLNIGSGAVTTAGSLLVKGGANITFSGAGILNIRQNFEYGNGIFTAGSGTVVYNGDENQHVAHINYYNLNINKAAAIATIDSTVNIAGNFLVNAGQLDNFSTTTIFGNVTINAAGILNNAAVLHVKGDWNQNGTYFSTGASIFFDGNSTQNISASTFNNLNINKPVGSSAIATGNIALNGNLTITSGTFNIKTFDCNRNVQGGVLTLGDSATFIVGANNSPLNFTAGSLSNSSTVIADGTGPQFIFGESFGHLIFRNGGAKTLVSPITVNGNLTIESGSNFDAGSQTLTLNGNWINNGTFTPSSSAVLCSGIAKTISGNSTFNRLSVYGSYTILNNVIFNGLLNISAAGSLSGGSATNVTINNNLINSGILNALGTTTFTGNVLQTLSLINATSTIAITVNFNGSVSPVLNSTSAPQFGYLNINNTGGINPSVGWTIAYGLTIGAGASFNGGINTHNFLGAVTNNGTITSSGILNFIPTSAATVNLGTNFSSTGRVVLGGAGAMTLAGSPNTLHNIVISNTNVAGITPSSNWIVANNFTVNSGSVFNAGSYTYTIGGNVRNSGIINRGTSTFLLNGSDIQDIFSATPFNNLTISKTGSLVTLSSTIPVYGALNFISGIIQTGANNIFIPSSATVTGTGQSTGWVNGNLQKNVAIGTNILRTFEVGDGSNYTPVSIVLANVSTSGDLTCKTIPSDHPNLSNSEMDISKTVNRYFTITNAGTAFTTASLSFNWVAADVDAGASTAAFRAKNYNGSFWTLLTVASPLPTSISVTGATAFGDFAIGQLAMAIWTGSINTDWSGSGNWSSGVPLNVTNATIPGNLTNYPVLTTGTVAVQNLTIEPGASITVDGAVLQINGSINNSGSFLAGNGTIELNGSVAQAIPPNTFAANALKNLTINNVSGVTLGETLLLSGILKVTNGQFITNNHLTLLSTALQTALIDGSGSGEVTGIVTMQRYLASGFGYRYISSPFQSATVKELSGEVNLASSFPLFYRYDENQVGSGWVKYTDSLNALGTGEGYLANFGSLSTPKTFDITGVVNNHAVSTATLYNHNKTVTRGFNLAGNPYPSPIDWESASGWIRPNIDDALYYFNNSAINQYAGTYSTFINNVSSDGVASNIIASMQGFFVHVSDTNAINNSYPVAASLTFDNSVRFNNLAPNYHRQMAVTFPLLRINASFADEKMAADPVVIYFVDNATKAFDPDFDALKLLNTDPLVPNLYAIGSDKTRLSICAWPALKDSTEIVPLGLQIKHAGWITFNATARERFAGGWDTYLYDAETNTYQDLWRLPKYRLYLETGSYDTRFSIVFSRGMIQPIPPAAAPVFSKPVIETFTIYNSGGIITVNYTLPPGEKALMLVTNVLGQVVLQQELNGDDNHPVSKRFITGLYVVSISTTKKVMVKKVFVGKN